MLREDFGQGEAGFGESDQTNLPSMERAFMQGIETTINRIHD
jgi:hypothetical protein